MCIRDSIETVWGESGVGGNDGTMRYPPERLHGNGNMSEKQNAKWMNEQFKTFIKSTMGSSSDSEIAARKSARLVSDVQTSRGDGSYLIWHKSADGFGGEQLRPLMQDGVAVRWKPDWEKSTEKGRLDRDLKREIDINRAKREKKLFGTAIPKELLPEPATNFANPLTGRRF